MFLSFTLSPEEQKFAAENHNLVLKFLNENILDENEYYDIVVFGFINAVHKYLTDESLRKYAFSTIAWRDMRSSLKNHFEAQNRKKRHAVTVSLDENTISPMDSLMADFETELLLHSIESVVSEAQMQAIRLKMAGYGIKKIAKKLNLTMKAVQQLLTETQAIVTDLCLDQ